MSVDGIKIIIYGINEGRTWNGFATIDPTSPHTTIESYLLGQLGLAATDDSDGKIYEIKYTSEGGPKKTLQVVKVADKEGCRVVWNCYPVCLGKDWVERKLD